MEMMKSITVDGKRFMFECESWGTRSGFAHGCKMWDMENLEKVAEAKRFYLNRTWECWDFQSAILDAVDKAVGYVAGSIREKLFDANGWQKMTAKRREALIRALELDPEYGTLQKLYKELRGNRPAWDY